MFVVNMFGDGSFLHRFLIRDVAEAAVKAILESTGIEAVIEEFPAEVVIQGDTYRRQTEPMVVGDRVVARYSDKGALVWLTVVNGALVNARTTR